MQLPGEWKWLQRRQYKRMILGGLLLVLAIVSLSSCRPDLSSASITMPASPNPALPTAQTMGTLNQILAARRIRIAVPQDFPPFGSTGPAMTIQGYDVDVAKLLAADLQVELDLVPVTSAERLRVLQTGRVDAVIASLGANPERAKSVYFSKAYAPFYSGIYGTATVAAATYDDLLPYRVGVTKDSLEDLELSQKAPADLTIARYQNNALTLSALLSGEVEAIATSNVAAAQLIQDNPDKAIGQKFIMKNSPCYIGIRRGDLDFLQWLDVFVTSKRLGGELETLAEQWFGEPLGELPS